jgi:hypothetical protein
MNFLGKEWSGKFSGDRYVSLTEASRLCNWKVNRTLPAAG